jgi:lipoate-protein ligase A
MTLRLVDLSLESPEENLALDEALLLEAEAAAADGRELGYLRFWESPKSFVVLGVSSALEEDADPERCRADGVPILRRASGGGTVLQGPGCLNFTLVLPLGYTAGLRDINSSYRMILDPCREALGLEGSAMRGSCDLALGDRKFSGNAQKRSRHCLLHQGTLLWNFDLSRIPLYLRQPRKQPEYREAREHLDFVMNLPLDATELRQRIASAWETSCPESEWRPPPLDALLEEKYLNREWIERF